MRKISSLIEKVSLSIRVLSFFSLILSSVITEIFNPLIQAIVDKNQEVLEIGCGWGTLAIELVKRTGCKYTGVTLSEEQLRYAETKVKEAGLQVSTMIIKFIFKV